MYVNDDLYGANDVKSAVEARYKLRTALSSVGFLKMHVLLQARLT